MKYLVIGLPISYNRGILALKMMISGCSNKRGGKDNNMTSKYLFITSSTVLSQYDDATLKGLRKVVLNIGQATMWSYEIWSELDAQIVIGSYWRMTRILPTTWNVDFALVDEREENRMRRIR